LRLRTLYSTSLPSIDGLFLSVGCFDENNPFLIEIETESRQKILSK